MIWIDRIAQKLDKAQHVDDMFTPSGIAHIGSLRGPVLHDVAYRVLSEKNKDTVYTYLFNDFDTIDGLAPDLREKFEKYMGYPLRMAPSPDGKKESFAHYYTDIMKSVLDQLGVNATYLSSWDLYHEGKFNDVIRTALDHKEDILEVYRRIGGYSKKTDDWYPLQVICPNCHKNGTSNVTGWDGEKVKFKCEPELVKWAKGCGHEGTISPFDGNAKLPWKVDWPAHWKVLGVTFEGAGKDHASRGGSYDIAFELCEKVFKIQKPYYFPYEFFLIGGKKMSSSKGLGASSKDIANVLPPEVFRFLIVRTPPERSIELSFEGDSIPNLFDDYDRCMNAYFDKIDNKIGEGKQADVARDFARIIELSRVKGLPKKRMLLPRFRTVMNLIKTKAPIEETFEKQKGSALTAEETGLLRERIKYAEIYLKNFAGENAAHEMIKEIPTGLSLNDSQTLFLKTVRAKLEALKSKDRDLVTDAIFNSLKENDLKPKEVFSAFYQILIGKDAGPKAADLILEFGTDKVTQRISDALSGQQSSVSGKSYTWTHDSIFSIDPELAKKFPSISIGVAIIKGVDIKKSSEELQKQTDDLLASMSHLTNEVIGSYPEVLSYRKLYKQMGVDWHSRRPSPEALLRRVALKKGLYRINTCVDAYNLVVMKHRVSIGAFDLDTIKFPTHIRLAKAGEEILLLGDKEPTKYKETEIAYFDQEGGYNIDFNYRDAQRTAVRETSKNILLNVDGIYDITPEQVERSLQESVDMIRTYCGGTVELQGIVVPG